MKTKTLKITFEIDALIGRGLASLAEYLHNSVECAKFIGRDHLQSCRSSAGTIRDTLRDLGPSNRAWAISWLRLGVQIHRQRYQERKAA